MNTSQTVEDVVKESQQKWQKYVIDTPLAERAKDLFENSSKIDPTIYKGEAKPYQRKEVHESSIEVQNRMSKKSPDIKQHFGKECYEAQKRLPPSARKYSGNFEDVAKQYLSGEGKELYSHLSAKGRKFYDVNRIGTGDLGDAVAGLAIYGDEAALLGSHGFEERVSELASHYGVSADRAKSYVLAHEFVHASQKGKYFDDEIQRELDVENTLKEYFTAKGDKDLAMIAGDRAANVTKNYGGAKSYSPKNVSIESYVGSAVSSN